MKLTDISNSKAKEIINGAPQEATHFSCIEGKTQYYKNETVISSIDEIFINVFRDIFQPSVFLLSDLEKQMNVDNIATQTQEEKEALDGIAAKSVQCGYSVDNALSAIAELDKFNDTSKLKRTPIHRAMDEWNGEGLPPVGVECEWIGGGIAHGDWGLVIVHAYHNEFAWIEKLHDNSMKTVCNPAHFRKPESPEEKEKRERLEAAYDLYVTGQESVGVIGYQDFDDFTKDLMQVKFYNSIVDKTNYRKEQ